MSLSLEITSGPRIGERLQISGARFLVGRAANSNAKLTDDHMSSNHFVISQGSDDWIIEDLNSLNGTFLNDKPIQRASLQNGDGIRAGNTSFLVHFSESFHAFGLWRVPAPSSERGWQLIPDRGFKLAGDGPHSSIMFAEDKVHPQWTTEAYLEQQRQIIFKHMPAAQVSEVKLETLAAAGPTFALDIQIPNAHQKQFYLRTGEQMSILTITLLDSEKDTLRPDLTTLLSTAQLALTE